MKKPCEVCEGSGQVSYFKGASRFLLSWEDCPGCFGAGFVELPEEQEGGDKSDEAGEKEQKKE